MKMIRFKELNENKDSCQTNEHIHFYWLVLLYLCSLVRFSLAVVSSVVHGSVVSH